MTAAQRKIETTEYEVVNNSKEGAPVIIDGKTLPFGSSGAFKTNDYGLARAIREKYGMHGTDGAVVVPVTKPPERGYKKTFRVQLPKNYKG